MKIIITESQLKKLNEDITASRMIVYHRTGKSGFNPSKNIADIGYNIGKGNAYGYGVYTTYDLESQLNDKMRNTYGDIIIESKILDMSKFLIFNYDIAKKIYKSRYQFGYQLKQILGKKEWLNYKNNDTIKDIHNTLDEGIIKYTSDLAHNFSKLFRDSILRKLNGIIFTGQNDGNVLVVYNRKNIEPLRYSEDDGQTWTNVRNVKTYQRIKDSDEYKKDTELQHILNKLENENLDSNFIKIIPEKYHDILLQHILNKLENEPIFRNFIIAIPEKYHDILLNHLSKKGDKLNKNEIDFINNLKFFKKFGDFDIFKIFNNSKDKKQTTIEIIEMKGDSLDSYDIKYMLSDLTKSGDEDFIDILVIKIIDLKGEKLNSDDIKVILLYSSYKDSNYIDSIIIKIIEKIGDKLDLFDITTLFNYSVNKDFILSKIIERKGKYTDKYEIGHILDLSNNKDNIAMKLIEFTGKDLGYLLIYSDNKDDNVSKKIIEVMGEELTDNQVYTLFRQSKDKELIKKLLLQKGVDYKLINNVIDIYNKTNNFDMPLIPDNYQSMLQEIRRIKEIIR